MNSNEMLHLASLANLGGSDLAIILMIVLLLFAVKKLPELAGSITRNDRPPGDLFSDLTKMLLLAGVVLWALIIAEYL